MKELILKYEKQLKKVEEESDIAFEEAVRIELWAKSKVLMAVIKDLKELQC